MPVGFPTKTTYANGDVFSADDINSTNGTLNLLGLSASTSAGKNAMINGGFDIWQRGTSVSVSTLASTYTADRWNGVAGASTAYTVSRQTTSDTTNLPTIQYCARVQRNSGQTGTSFVQFAQSIESVNSVRFAGQAVTLSFYARRGANYSAASNVMNVLMNTGTGTDQQILAGFTGSVSAINSTATLTTTWQRFTFTATLATNINQIGLDLYYTPVGTAGANDYFEITGVQLELGSTATTFSRAGGTIQGELAACQRYYFRQVSNAAGNALFGNGHARNTTTDVVGLLQAPVEMRVVPTAVDYSTLRVTDGATAFTITSLTIGGECNTISFKLNVSVASGLTAYRPYDISANNSSSAYLGFSAEL